jgi:hypothetical protein
VALAVLEELGDLVVADEQAFMLAIRQRRIGQRVLDARDLRLASSSGANACDTSSYSVRPPCVRPSCGR